MRNDVSQIERRKLNLEFLPWLTIFYVTRVTVEDETKNHLNYSDSGKDSQKYLIEQEFDRTRFD